MKLTIIPTSKSNQSTFTVKDVKTYKFTGKYTVEVEFNSGSKESYYAIESVEVIQTKPKFESHSQWYYIDNQGFIKESSPKSAEVLSKVHTLYSDWNEAYKALEEYNKVFTTWTKKKVNVNHSWSWDIVIWEDIEETSKLTTLKFKGGYEEAVNYAKAKLNHYKTNPESHFTIE